MASLAPSPGLDLYAHLLPHLRPSLGGRHATSEPGLGTAPCKDRSPEQEMAPPPQALPPREPALEAPGLKARMDLHICLVPQDTGLVGGALERGERSQGHVSPPSPAPGSLPGSTHRCSRRSAYTCSSKRRCLRRKLRPRAGKGLTHGLSESYS